MAHKLERSLSSLSAIAAATLLLSNPALAQSQPATDTSAQPPASAAAPAPAPDPQPPVVQTPAAPAATAAPAEAAPAAPAASTTTPAPVMTTNPVVQSIPDSSQSPAAQTPAPQTQTTTTARATQPRGTARTSASTAARANTPAPQAAGGIPAATAAQKPAPSDAPSPGLTRRDPAGLYNADGSPATTQTTQTTTTRKGSPYARYWPLEAAGGIIVIGLIGYAFTRRRDEEDEVAYTTPVTEQPVTGRAVNETPLVDQPAMAAAPVTATAAPAVQPLTQAPSVTLDRDQAPTASVMPAGPVPSGAERQALLERMVAAPPDAANPFRTVKARMRRARMILAARKQALRDQATEAFDWRTYQPSLKPATLGGETPIGDATGRTGRETVK